MTDKDKFEFWRAFQTEARTLAHSLSSGDLRTAYDAVESLLQRHGFDFCFELTEEAANAVLVLTPEGDPRRAREIDELVSAMPQLAGWRVYGRRQRKPLADAFTFVRHVFERDATDATFDVHDAEHGYEITLYSKAVDGLTQNQAEGLAMTLLDHALGEETVMSRVSKVEARAGGHGALPLRELVATVMRN